MLIFHNLKVMVPKYNFFKTMYRSGLYIGKLFRKITHEFDMILSNIAGEIDSQLECMY